MADLRQLSALCRTVLGTVSPRDEAIGGLLNWLESRSAHGAMETFAAEIVERLFDLAPALPVVFSQVGTALMPTPIVPPRLGGVPVDGHLALTSVTARPPKTGRIGPRHVGVSSRRGGLITSVALRERLSQVGVALARVRRSAWISAGIGLGGLVIALAVLPPAGTDAARGGSPLAEAVEVAATPAIAPPADPAVLADDAVAAARALFVARARCLAESVMLCLDDVDQPGSSAMEADRYLLHAASDTHAQAASASAGVDTAVLVERLGDSALVALTLDQPGSAPVSVLIVKGEAGWRIRDVLVG